MVKRKMIKVSITLMAMTLGLSHALCAKETVIENSTIEVELKEWMINVDKSEVKSGEVTFQISNRGVENHELVVIKSEMQHDQLPTVAGKVDEVKAGELIGEVEDFAPQGSYKASFKLAPGKYVLICNIVEKEPGGGLESHYHEGMHYAFTVLP